VLCHSRPRFALPAALLAALALSSSSMAGAASAQRVAILGYHHIGRAPHDAARPELWVPAARFRRQLAALDRAGYEAVTLDRVWRAWHGNATLPARPVVLSFDDGYASQGKIAAPALRAHGWPGVLNLQVRRIGARGGLSKTRVRALLRAGWELDAHSVTHPDLTRVSNERLAHEVAGSRRALQQTFGAPVDFFAYPYGRQDARVRAAVRRAGFLAATTTRAQFASSRTDPFALGRVLVTAGQSPRALLQLLQAGG
jgi:peptidoglycan/xylan/chitin deacetylase (PgdA/CDA1 family)